MPYAGSKKFLRLTCWPSFTFLFSFQKVNGKANKRLTPRMNFFSRPGIFLPLPIYAVIPDEVEEIYPGLKEILMGRNESLERTTSPFT